MVSNLSQAHVLNSPAAITKLMALAERARERIPFYRESLAPIDFSTPDLSLSALPLLEKSSARQAGEAMVRPEFLEERPGTFTAFTSGSTGMPLRLIRTKIEMQPSVRAFWRARAAIFPDVLNATGVLVNEFGWPADKIKPKPGLIRIPMAGYTRENYLDKLISLHPRWLSGSPALLSLLVENMLRYNRRFQTRLAFVESTSDCLEYEMRTRLAEFFECPVVNQYGCEELLTIAYECPKGKMHLFDNCVVAELLPLPESNEYELVASTLILETMPFIRYRLGDGIQLEENHCTCGNTAPILGQIQGRTSDLIAGTVLSGHVIFSQFMHAILKQTKLTSLLRYQIHQTAMNDFLVLLQLEDLASPQKSEHLQIISTAFRAAIKEGKPQWTFTFECVDHIALTPGGKVQYFVCHI